MKSAGFHEIHQISPWNPPDFMNSVFYFFRTNTDIQYYMLNRQNSWSTTELLYFFHQKQSPWHEIHWISWNLPNFMKFARFHEICRISWSTTTRLYFSSEPIQIYTSLSWNPPDFMKSARFHEICQISISWNPADSQMS